MPDREQLIAQLRAANEVRNAAAEALEKIDPNWRQSAELRKQLPDFLRAERFHTPSGLKGTFRYEEALGLIGDAYAVESLRAALHEEDANYWSRKRAVEALDQIERANSSLIRAYPALLCSYCGLRGKKRIWSHRGWWRRLVVCRGCGYSNWLLPGVENVIGVLGGTFFALKREGDTVRLPLWSEAEQRARNADITRLVIVPWTSDYERAINAVAKVFKDDVSRPRSWCRKIPVVLQDQPPLSSGSLKLLRATFRKIGYENTILATSSTSHIVTCSRCSQKIRLPKGRGTLRVTCPQCSEKFVART